MHKDFKSWLGIKEKLHYSDKLTPFFKEREIWWSNLGANVGVEMDGKHEMFIRPAVILRKFNKEMAIIMPITTKEKVSKYYFDITSENGKKYKTCLSQIRVMSSKRFFRKIDEISRDMHLELKYQVCKMIMESL